MTKKLFAIVLLIPFSLLTVYAVYKVGYIGVFDYQRHSPAGWQVFADLVIACLLCLSWLIPEAKLRPTALFGNKQSKVMFISS